MSDIYGDRLKTAYHVIANHLESGVWLNLPGKDGEPRFEWMPFPRIAQIAPCYGIVVQDFNSDGNPDLHLVQNSYSTQPETGLWRGGLSQLLHGKGDGSFGSVPPKESGLVIPDDGKASALVDLDGDHHPDLIATQNNGQALAFKTTVQDTLEIRLSGPKGNLHGIGAKVILTRKNGMKESHEIKAGTGYLSQSPSLIFTTSEKLKVITVLWPDGHEKIYPAPTDSSKIVLPK